MLRAEPFYGPKRQHIEVRTDEGARRSARLHDRGTTMIGNYWPGGANSPRSKNAIMRGGGAGTMQMPFSPGAHKSTKDPRHQQRSQERMDTWLDGKVHMLVSWFRMVS